MGIEKIREIFEVWEVELLRRQKKYIHFFSMRNFVYHFDYLPNLKLKEKTTELLSNYIIEVQDNFFDYNGEKSYNLARAYMDKLSEIYRSYLGFKPFFRPALLVLVSVLGDGISYILFNKFFSFWFPMISLFVVIYYIYIKMFMEKKRKIFGLFY